MKRLNHKKLAEARQASIVRADLHVQAWRSGMAKLIINLAMREDLDDFRHEFERLEGWRELKAAALASPAVMAELRAHYAPDDEVRVP